MDDPSMTMDEYIKLEEEKARRRGRVFNWETATYGKIRVDDDFHDLRSVETEFPAIVVDDTFASQNALPCESKVSTPVNNEIEFIISFDESDDENYVIICDKNSFSYKMISVNNLKTDLENDNEKASIPSFPPPDPTTSYLDDSDFLNDFENEFPAIVYNGAQTSKSVYLTEPTLSPQHIDESDLKDEISLSEYDEVEHNVLYLNDLFPFNIIRLDDLKSDEDNDNNEIDIVQSSGESFVMELNVNIVTWIYLFNGMLLYFIMNLYVAFGIPFDPKRYYKDGDCAIMLRRPRYEGLQYTDVDIMDFEMRLTRIYRREVHRVQVFDFRGLPDLMADGLSARMLMEHRDAQGVNLFTSRAWRRLFDIRGPLLGGARRRLSWRQFILALGLHTTEEMKTVGFGAYWADSARQIPDKGGLRDYWIGISSAGDFLGTAPSYTTIRDPILRLCHRLIACSIAGRSQAPEKVTVTNLFNLRGMDVGLVNVPYLLARYLRLFAAGRKSGAHISGGQFVTRLAKHFGLLTAEIL
ncbi:hypothetical protein Tco_0571602 [Tanacetum coccineum]